MASLVIGIVGIPTFGVLLVGAIVGVVLGMVALTRLNRQPQAYGGRGLAIGGIVTNVGAFLLGILLPTFHSRVAMNEASAIGDVRTIISAEKRYASANQGFFDSLECVATPERCIPGYSAVEPRLLEDYVASSRVRTGYQRTFYPGPRAEVDGDTRSRVSPSSLLSFAYVAVPLSPGVTGVRSFCGDSSGRICALRERGVPQLENGLCARSCPDLR